MTPTPTSAIELVSTLDGGGDVQHRTRHDLSRCERILFGVQTDCRRVSRWWLVGASFAALLLGALTTTVVVAQESDPDTVIAAYSAALNAHDVAAALALFDAYGSAADAQGHHYEGQSGLTQFLLSNGFGSPGAQITTRSVHALANRAVWTFACSCTAGLTEVRIITRNDKISVFAIVPSPGPSTSVHQSGLPWWLWVGVAGGAVLVIVQCWRGQAQAEARRPARGLLAALAEARLGQRPTPGPPGDLVREVHAAPRARLSGLL
jgi:hypothetical protein